MRQKTDAVVKIALVVGDALALAFSFGAAYLIRIYLDPRPFVFESQFLDFFLTVVSLVPILLIILAALGLYKKNVYMGSNKLPQIGKLVLASILSVAALITYDFFRGENLFPVRIMAVSSLFLSFFFLIFERALVITVAKTAFRHHFGAKKAVVIGNNANTLALTEYITDSPEAGYELAGVVAAKKYIPKELKTEQFSSLKDALKRAKVDVIFQTDGKNTEYVYKQAVNRHILYYFVPNEVELSSQLGEFELIGATPTILVKVTPLSGWMAGVKRGFDILIALIGLILAAIPMLLIWISLKISDPKHSAFYSDYRLTRFNRRFKCYKFRTMKPEYSGMTAEEAFEKMGRKELAKKYRENGDYLANDPRITKFGHFLRRTSLDELPQLFNILKGDISLIGPRALLPGELRKYGDRSLILSVKSGLTGLAQVSGRRNISFEERRRLDIYYVKNWSLTLDAQIFFKTIGAVLKGEGAK